MENRRSIVLIGESKAKLEFKNDLKIVMSSNNYPSCIGVNFSVFDDEDKNMLYYIYDTSSNTSRFISAYKTVIKDADFIILVNASKEQEEDLKQNHRDKRVFEYDSTKTTPLQCIYLCKSAIDSPAEISKATPETHPNYFKFNEEDNTHVFKLQENEFVTNEDKKITFNRL